MAFQKRVIAYVSYSDESEDFLRIGLQDYNEKSFAFSIEYLGDLTKDKLNTKQKRIMEQVKVHFSKTDDPELKEESLNGLGNTKLTDADGNLFFGYIYSKQYGQKALDWFATRAILLPTKRELERAPIPEGMEKDSDEYNEYLEQYSRKDRDDLYDALSVPVARPASRYQKAPVYTTKGPTKEVLGKTSPTAGKTTARKPAGAPTKFAGIPSSTSAKAKKITLKEAIDTIFEAMLSGEIGDDYEYSKDYDPEEGEEKRVAFVTANRLIKKKEFADANGYESRDDVPELKGPTFFFLIKSEEEKD